MTKEELAVKIADRLLAERPREEYTRHVGGGGGSAEAGTMLDLLLDYERASVRAMLDEPTPAQ